MPASLAANSKAVSLITRATAQPQSGSQTRQNGHDDEPRASRNLRGMAQAVSLCTVKHVAAPC